MRPSQLLVLRRDAFERLCEERPILALHLVRRLARLVSRRLRLTSGQLVEQLGN
jgi:CRP-like cAMP-binding protein